MNKKIKVIIQLSISILLIFILYKYLDYRALKETLSKLKIFPIVTGFLIFIIACLLNAYKWRAVLKAMNRMIPAFSAIKFYLYTMFYNMFLPGSNSSDIIRTMMINKYIKSYTVSLGSIFWERFIGMVVLALFCIIGLSNTNESMKLPSGIKTPIITVCIFIIFIFIILVCKLIKYSFIEALIVKFIKHKKISSVLQNFSRSVLLNDMRLSIFFYAVFISIISQTLIIVTFILAGNAINCDMNYSVYFIVIPVMSFVKLIPLTFNSIGVREGALMYLFSFYGNPPDKSAIIGLVSLGYALITGIIMGIYHIFDKEILNTKIKS